MTNNTMMNLKLAVDAMINALGDNYDAPLKKVKVLKDGFVQVVLADGTKFEWDGLDLYEDEEEEE